MSIIVLKSATKVDMELLWRWRNNKQVRKNSLNSKEIVWLEHRKWFLGQLRDNNCIMYIAFKEKVKIGVIRFNVEDDFVSVSVSLNPDFLGQGLGKLVIRQGTDKFFSEVQSNEFVQAVIKLENIVSQEAFFKAGYQLIKKEESSLIYRYSRCQDEKDKNR